MMHRFAEHTNVALRHTTALRVRRGSAHSFVVAVRECLRDLCDDMAGVSVGGAGGREEDEDKAAVETVGMTAGDDCSINSGSESEGCIG